MTTILVATKYELERQAIAILLEQRGYVTVLAADGRTALQCLLENSPSVAILERELPVLNGEQVAHELSKRGINTKVLLVTRYRYMLSVKRSFDSGVHGILSLKSNKHELFFAIEEALKGKKYVSQRLLPHLSHLTEREREVFYLIIQGLTAQAIARKLYVSIKTVESHTGRILKKLGASNKRALISMVYQDRLDGFNALNDDKSYT